MATVIEVEGLEKNYRRFRSIRKGKTTALDKLSFSVPEGGVFGFLGPNGSGKTTTIRCLLGLIRPTSGKMTLFGRTVPGDLAGSAKNVGAIVETPAFFPTMSGHRNLSLLASTAGISRRRVDEVLAEVGLADRAGSLVKSYSLGMRQRLGVAAVLLKDPKLLILDEPSNGLDPSGIRYIRSLMRRLGDEGRTVFVSSHLLSEVEQTCDHVAVLSRGRCVTSGSVQELLSRASHGSEMRIRVDDIARAEAVLKNNGFSVMQSDNMLVIGSEQSIDVREQGKRINECLGSEGLWLSEMTPVAATLEEAFLELTRDQADVPLPRDQDVEAGGSK